MPIFSKERIPLFCYCALHLYACFCATTLKNALFDPVDSLSVDGSDFAPLVNIGVWAFNGVARLATTIGLMLFLAGATALVWGITRRVCTKRGLPRPFFSCKELLLPAGLALLVSFVLVRFRVFLPLVGLHGVIVSLTLLMLRRQQPIDS